MVDAIVRRLGATAGDTVLDIGCGWGLIARYVAAQTGAVVHGVTLSDAQASFIRSHASSSSASGGNVVLLHMNYRDVPETTRYDKIYSIEMLEAVRCTDYRDAFMRKETALLKPGGRFVLQCITNASNYSSGSTCEQQAETFVSTHIFPGGQFVLREHLLDAAAFHGLKLAGMEVYGGQHYARTLRLWRRNLLRASGTSASGTSASGTSASGTSASGTSAFEPRLVRAYDYYFASMEACFSLDVANVTHFVFEKVRELRLR